MCSDIPPFREAFTDDEATFFKSDHELTIDQTIQEAWKDNEKPNKAYQKEITSYSEERMGEEYRALFERLVNKESWARNIELRSGCQEKEMLPSASWRDATYLNP